MFRIAHLSDLHFGRQLPGLIAQVASGLQGHDPQAVVDLGFLISDLSDEADEFRVAVTGDLTVAGTAHQFELAREFVSEQAVLAGPTALGLVTTQAGELVIPGNHDYGPRRLLDPASQSDHFAAFFGPQPAVSNPIALGEGWSIRFLQIDSTRDAGRSDLLRARGSCQQQLADLSRRLAALGSKPRREVRVLLLHHAPSYLAARAPYFTEVDAASRDAIHALVVHHQIDALLSGHTHAANLNVHRFGGETGRLALDATCGSSAKRTTLKAGGPETVPRDRRLSVVVHDLIPTPETLTWTASIRVKDVGPFRAYHRGSPRMRERKLTLKM